MGFRVEGLGLGALKGLGVKFLVKGFRVQGFGAVDGMSKWWPARRVSPRSPKYAWVVGVGVVGVGSEVVYGIVVALNPEPETL